VGDGDRGPGSVALCRAYTYTEGPKTCPLMLCNGAMSPRAAGKEQEVSEDINGWMKGRRGATRKKAKKDADPWNKSQGRDGCRRRRCSLDRR